MKKDEKIFFLLCVKWANPGNKLLPRVIIDILYDCGLMHYKRGLYLLRKWAGLGFYEYGVSIDLGWFLFDKLPQRYAQLLDV